MVLIVQNALTKFCVLALDVIFCIVMLYTVVSDESLNVTVQLIDETFIMISWNDLMLTDNVVNYYQVINVHVILVYRVG